MSGIVDEARERQAARLYLHEQGVNCVFENFLQGWLARSQQDALPRWIPVSEQKPKCSKKPNSPGTPVLVYPPYNEDGYSQMTQAFYGCRQTDEPNFYIFGRVFDPTHWMPLPSPPPGEAP